MTTTSAVDVDVAVVGGGPGGYVAAIRGSQCGLDVALIERDAFGGTCLNYGCIPSKALITVADRLEKLVGSDSMGLQAEATVHYPDTIQWKNRVVAQLTNGVESLCQANGIDLIGGTAQFTGKHSIAVHNTDGEKTINFDEAIIATGSQPIQLPGFDFAAENILDSKQALALEEIPEKIVIIGGGYIGMELATTFAKFNAEVTVVEMLDQVLPGYEAGLAEIVQQQAKEYGVSFNFNEKAIDWERNTGITVKTEDDNGQSYTYDADHILVAVGREPVTGTLNLEKVGVSTDEQGYIPTDEQMKTEVDNISAVGDVAGKPMLAHQAFREGVVAAESIAGEPAAVDNLAIPAAVFTDPEIATVGLSRDEAADAGYAPVIGEMPFNANGRALTLQKKKGFVRLVADEETGFILGGQIVGADASELISEISLAIELGATVNDIGSTIHVHPTLSEAVQEAAENVHHRSIHTTNN